MQLHEFFLNPAVVWVLIPMSAIVLCGTQKIARMYWEHQERMALIDRGDDPGPASSYDA